MILEPDTTIASRCHLVSLARSLGRPVRFGWLNLAVGDAALLLAADRADLAGADLTDVWRDLQGEMRQAVSR
jgi:hypothetical protein